jgi:hypothetical protein
VNRPVPMSKTQLLKVLDDIRAHVADDDSWEGSLQYSIPEEPRDGVDFDVHAGYRIGNSLGQGGFRLIAGDPVNTTPKDPS